MVSLAHLCVRCNSTNTLIILGMEQMNRYGFVDDNICFIRTKENRGVNCGTIAISIVEMDELLLPVLLQISYLQNNELPRLC